MKPFICFIHIGKNGGSTFHQILNNNMPLFFSINYDKRTGGDFKKHHLNKLLKITPVQGVGGHTIKSYLDYEAVVKQPVFYITFLREPLKRYVSLVNYRMYSGWSDGIEKDLSDSRMSNQQVHQISGQYDITNAVKILQQLDFVGILEEFDTSLLLLKQELEGKFELKVNYIKENVAKNRNTDFNKMKNLSPEMLERVRRENLLDIELYEAGLQKFEKMKAAYKGDLEKDLAVLRASNREYKRKQSKYLWQKAKNVMVRKVIQPLILRNEG